MRAFIKWFAGIAAIAGLTACANEDESPVKVNAGEDGTLKLLSWSEYFDEETFEAFEQETGISVEYVTYDDPDELEARLISEPGLFDVVVADDVSISRLAELRLLHSLDKSQLPHFRNVAAEYVGNDFDRENQWSVPYLWGTTLVAFRTDKIDDPGESWDILWDSKFKGKVMLLGDRTEALGIGLMAKGYPINSAEAEEVHAAADHIISAIRDVDARLGSDAEVREALDSGEVWAASCYSGDAAMVALENENVGFFIPSSGAPLWMDSFAITGSSSKVPESHSFIDFMLRAETAAANANFTWYGSTNTTAEEYISKELLADTTVNPPKSVRDLCELYNKPDAAREELLNEAWSRVKKAYDSHNRDLASAGKGEPG